MSSDFCIKCDGELSVYCGPCVDKLRAEVERFRSTVREKERLELEALQELDEARAEVERLRAAAEKAVARCSYGCQPGSYCGRCEPLLAALAGKDKP